MRSASRFGLIIFDCDGVLVDTERHMEVVDLRLIAELGWPITVEEIRCQHLGRSTADVLANIERHICRRVPPDFRDRRKAAYREQIGTGLDAVPGAPEAVQNLAAHGYRMCVASSGSPESIESSLMQTSLRRWFGSDLFSSHHVSRGKPAPDLFLDAAQAMGHPARDCLVIEDSPTGITAARAAGMAVIGLAQRTPAALLVDSDTIITSMCELPGAVARLDDDGV